MIPSSSRDIGTLALWHPPQAVSRSESVTIAFRLRGIPKAWGEISVEEFVKAELQVDGDMQVIICSLASNPSRPENKIATLEFSKLPTSVFSNYRTGIDMHMKRGRNRLILDTNFYGFTPLHIKRDEDCDMEYVQVKKHREIIES